MGISVLPETKPAALPGRRMRGLTLLATVAVVAAGAGGFAVTRGGPSAAPVAIPARHAAPVAAAPLAKGWKRSDLHPVSQPLAVAGHFVSYVASKGVLSVVSLDAKTGKTSWKDTASSSDNAPGIGPTLVVVDGLVVYLHSEGRDLARVVAANASTGKAVWTSATGEFSSWPELCPGDAQSICLSGYLGSTTAVPDTLLRFEAFTGEALDGAPVPSAARSVDAGLYDLNDGTTPEQLISPNGSTVDWTRDLAQIFTTPGSTTDDGWDFERVGRSGLFVGSVGARPLSQTKATVTLDLSRTMTAGFRITDGSVVWRDTGTTYLCTDLPCPGDGLRSDAPSFATNAGPTVGVRMRATGTASGASNGDGKTTLSQGTRVALEGFDPATGRTLWTFHAGDIVDLLGTGISPAFSNASSIVLTNSAGTQVVLDLANGTTSPVTAGDYWCQADVHYQQNFAYVGDNGTKFTNYDGQAALFPCDAKQHRKTTPARIPGFIGDLGASADGLVAWSDTNAIIAAPPGTA